MKVLLADDHDLVRETIAAFLVAEGVGSVLTAASLPAALHLIQAEGPCDLIVLDYNMPGMNGFAGLAQVRKAQPGVPVAILSGTASREMAEAALREGARGFLPKTLGAKTLVHAMRLIAAGETFLPFGAVGGDPEEGPFNLTRREVEVLRGICEGKSNKEIARDHDLQEVTVKLHVSTLTRKLGARNRTHAAMIARDHNLA
jgi:DNA-binding NarL/FixJ family response regulator